MTEHADSRCPTLSKNLSMFGFSSYLTSYEPDPQVVLNRLRYLIHHHSLKLDKTTKIGVVGEEIVNQAIIDYSRVDRRIIPHPIHDKIQLQKWRVRYNSLNQIKIVNRQTEDDSAEFDAIMVCDNIPLLVEVKMTCEHIEPAIKPATISHRIRIMQEIFNSERVGYGIVVYPEIIDEPEHAYLMEFTSRGGLSHPILHDSTCIR